MHSPSLLFLLHSLFGGICASWIDPDTPKEAMQAKSFTSGAVYTLVMSDEFNKDGRSFKDGHDSVWTAIERSDVDQNEAGMGSLQFYNSSYAYTAKGKLVIRTTDEDTIWRGYNPVLKKYTQLKRHFRSAMVQSWNKFCFTGGIFEVDIKLPGASNIGGLWPAVWLLGNLGRATFEGSTNLVWPWSYFECDRAKQQAQLISGCDVTEHFELHAHQGRGATEIDVVEIMPGHGPLPSVPKDVKLPYNSMTLQLAPGIPASLNRPQFLSMPDAPGVTWYRNLTYGNATSPNPFFYGSLQGPTAKIAPVQRTAAQAYQCDAISSLSSISEDFWDNMHTFRVEWQPGKNGYLHWYIDGEFKHGIEQEGLDFMKSKIPNEPSSIIFNTAISTSWGFPMKPAGCAEYDCKTAQGTCGFASGFCGTLPAKFSIDHVRVYQNINDSMHTTGCNPEGFPTSKFIEAKMDDYKNPNDELPLKRVVKGGGLCGPNQDNVCGEQYNAGNCVQSICVCTENWVGPHCLSPNAKDDQKAWDDEQDSIPPMQRLMLPGALELYTALFTIFFIGAIIAAVVRGPIGRIKSSNWL